MRNLAVIVEAADSSYLLMLVGGCSCVPVQELYVLPGLSLHAHISDDKDPTVELDNFILGGCFRVSESSEIIFCWR